METSVIQPAVSAGKGIPTHLDTCISKAIQTNCPQCGEPAWFFSCNCGSDTYFDQLGFPWEIHDCREYQLKKEFRQTKHIEFMTDKEIQAIVEEHHKNSGIEINEELLEKVAAMVGRRKNILSKTTILPVKGPKEISGKILTFNNPINIFRKLEYDTNPIGKKLLGKIGEKEWAQIKLTSRVNPQNHCFEYEVYVEKEYLKTNPLRMNDFIIGLAEGIQHPKGLIWVLKWHQVL